MKDYSLTSQIKVAGATSILYTNSSSEIGGIGWSQGRMIIGGAANWTVVDIGGSNGKVWMSNGTTASWQAVVGTGSVTSVDITVPGALLAVTGNPITAAGTFAITLPTQTANTIFSGPASGGAATPTFRALVVADLPARVNKRVYSEFDNTVSIGGGANTTMGSFTVPAALLSTNGDSIQFQGSGVRYGRSLTQQLYFTIDGTSIFSNAITPSVDSYWSFTCMAVRSGATALKYFFIFTEFPQAGTGGESATASLCRTGELTVTLSNTFNASFSVTVTGTGTTPYSKEFTYLCDFIPAAT